MREELAEVYGIALGDGCISRYYAKSDKRTRTCLVFTCHQDEAKYCEVYIRTPIKKCFGTKGYMQIRQKYHATILTFHAQNVVNWFMNKGFPCGKKQEIIVPETISKDKMLMRSCIRGIFDADGCVYRRYGTTYEHFVIQFKMKSKTLLQQIKMHLSDEGIASNQITRDRSCSVLRITTQSDVRRFMSIISPNNNRHKKRFNPQKPF